MDKDQARDVLHDISDDTYELYKELKQTPPEEHEYTKQMYGIIGRIEVHLLLLKVYMQDRRNSGW